MRVKGTGRLVIDNGEEVMVQQEAFCWEEDNDDGGSSERLVEPFGVVKEGGAYQKSYGYFL